MPRVYAKWTVTHLPEGLHDIHISCGIGDDQHDGFDLNDEGATLTVRCVNDGAWDITFTTPSGELEGNVYYWLSPCLLNDETEADEFGIVDEAREA